MQAIKLKCDLAPKLSTKTWTYVKPLNCNEIPSTDAMMHKFCAIMCYELMCYYSVCIFLCSDSLTVFLDALG